MASSSASAPLTPFNIHFLLLVLFVILEAMVVSASASSESSQLMERLRASRREPLMVRVLACLPYKAFLNDNDELLAPSKRNEPWMSILASNLLKDGHLQPGSMNYRGLRG
uniref:Secreted protein n=1 Tax=Steinernema glaseri TaxID=37863 RepID=A0A1I8ARL0_9BILA